MLNWIKDLFSHSPSLESGKIIEKTHTPARSWTTIIIIRTGKVMTPLPIPQYMPERWFITIEGTVEFKGKTLNKRREVFVDQKTYTDLNVGDQYTV